ncbi:hypothetical protein [Melittangium boletus]|nr:hypothetical protein [Melittangium boletus]
MTNTPYTLELPSHPVTNRGARALVQVCVFALALVTVLLGALLLRAHGAGPPF